MKKKTLWWSIFNETTEINSRPGTLVEKKPSPRRFSCEYIRTLSVLQEGLKVYFFDKIEGCVIQSWILLRCWSNIDFFSKKGIFSLYSFYSSF